MVRVICTCQMIFLGEEVWERARAFLEWRMQWKYFSMFLVTVGGPWSLWWSQVPASSFLPCLKGTFCSVNWHCCFNRGTVLMVLKSVCCTCPVLFMLWALDTVSICFPGDKFNIMRVVPENLKLWSFLRFLVYLLNIYWNGSWPGMAVEEEMLFNNTGLTCHHKWCKALFTLGVL